MKKQGPPGPLDESKITIYKNKTAAPNKRPATDDIAGAPRKKHASARSSNQVRKTASADRSASKRREQRPPKKIASSKPIPLDESSDDDAADLLNGSNDEESLESLEERVKDLNSGKLGEEFFESDSSILNSGDEQANNMFSEDEDEEDAEKILTAANIEGLSRKLDMEQEDMEANAQLELEEAAMQINLKDDKAVELEDDLDAEAGIKSTLQLAPDLQLLRTRITETIRVLDSGEFSKLAEGRSRSDYRGQLLKDISVYYNYSP